MAWHDTAQNSLTSLQEALLAKWLAELASIQTFLPGQSTTPETASRGKTLCVQLHGR